MRLSHRSAFRAGPGGKEKESSVRHWLCHGQGRDRATVLPYAVAKPNLVMASEAERRLDVKCSDSMIVFMTLQKMMRIMASWYFTPIMEASGRPRLLLNLQGNVKRGRNLLHRPLNHRIDCLQVDRGYAIQVTSFPWANSWWKKNCL